MEKLNPIRPCLIALHLSETVLAQEKSTSLLGGIEARIGLILLIASMVIIVLLILVIFYLHSINEHLSWIRRIR